jgi:hypothetical protein
MLPGLLVVQAALFRLKELANVSVPNWAPFESDRTKDIEPDDGLDEVTRGSIAAA